MKNDDCGSVRPLLPEWIRGEMGGAEARRVEGHVDACADCRTEGELVRALRASRPEPPAELAGHVKSALRAAEDRPRSGAAFPSAHWARSGLLPRVAAVAALLVLTASVLFLPGGDEPAGEVDGVELALDAVPEVWLSEDGVVAGAPLLADLSDEELTTLLEEMEP